MGIIKGLVIQYTESLSLVRLYVMDAIRSILLLVPGVIHLLPITGVLGGPRLAALYGIGISDNNLLILMQHRAILLGILGLFLIVAAFRSALQPLAIAAGLISTLSYTALAAFNGQFNDSLQRVLYVDIFAIICLLIAAALVLWQPTSKRA